MVSNLSVVNGKSATTSLGPGVTPYKLIASGVSADQNLVAAGSRVLYSISASNANAALRYVKLYNKATAPVVGTDIPTCVFAIPPSNSVNLTFNAGIAFPLGLGIGLVTGVIDGNSTSIGASETVVTLSYV